MPDRSLKAESASDRLDTSHRLIVRAIVAGAFVGGLTAAAQFLAGRLAMLSVDALASTAMIAGYVLVIAMIVWGLGIVLVGGPFWWMVHKIGLRGWLPASAMGFALPFLVTLAVAALHSQPSKSGSSWTSDGGGMTSVNGLLTTHGWAVQMSSSVLLGISGVLVALTIQRLAYRRILAET